MESIPNLVVKTDTLALLSFVANKGDHRTTQDFISITNSQ
jgi:hypothetical protein